MRFIAPGVTMPPSALRTAASRVSYGTAGLASARPTPGSAVTAPAVSRSDRQRSTAPSRKATSKAASA